jgi:polar amino acid transport system substrate-binding protein
VTRGDARDQFLTKAGFENLVRVTTNNQLFKMLMTNRIDVYAGATLGNLYTLSTMGISPKEIKKVYIFDEVQTYIAMSKGTSEEVVQLWNKALIDIKGDNTMLNLFNKYYVEK